MRTLTIIRHAKAEPAIPNVDDFDRVLSPRGVKDVRRIAKLLVKLEPSIDLVVSSPATRARQTAEMLAAKMDHQRPILWKNAIYGSGAHALLGILQGLPEDANHVALIGHNPGSEMLVGGLSSGAPHQLSVHMPTAAIASLRLEIFWWSQARWGCGQLNLLVKPKILRG
jgi:phosphohistidine phosphatase